MARTAGDTGARPQRRSEQHAAAPTGARFLLCEQTWTVLGDSLRLSRRELEIVRRIFNDQKESAIAADLGISPHTVHTERERLYHKLLINNRPQLVLRVVGEFLALTIAPGSILPPLCASQLAGICPLHNLTRPPKPTAMHRPADQEPRLNSRHRMSPAQPTTMHLAVVG